ncbi:MAG: AAA family ATPase [Aliihoeflea sp.]|uniref:AAA family ATPase n=1 Tax=Aliihoeflea sp. TaxID=2608088 RepID=UPI004034B691
MSDRLIQLVLARLTRRARRRAVSRAIDLNLLAEGGGNDDDDDDRTIFLRRTRTSSSWDDDIDQVETSRRGRLVPGYEVQDLPRATIARVLSHHGIDLEVVRATCAITDDGIEACGDGRVDAPAAAPASGDLVRAVWRSTWLHADEVAVVLLLREALARAGCDAARMARSLSGLPGPMITLVSPVEGFEACLADLIRQDVFARGSNTINGYELRAIKTSARRAPKPGPTIVLFRGDDASERDGDEIDGKIGVALRLGAPILAMGSTADGLPPRLVCSADLALETPSLTPNLIGEVIARVVGQEPSTAALDLLQPVCAHLTLRDLVTAIRPGHMPERIGALLRQLGSDTACTAAQPGRRIARTSGAAGRTIEKDRSGKPVRSGSDIVQPVPAATLAADPHLATVERLHGYGAAQTWALDLAQDLVQWRQGHVEWSDLSTKLLLSGPPGTGKTSFARALCNTLQLPLIATSVSTWLEPSHLGDVLRRMRVVFDEAQALAPAILFIDEIDGIGQRGQKNEYDDYWNAVVNKALELLDGAIRSQGVIVVGATNHPAMIDPALRRSGRLETHIEIPLPDVDALVGILAHHLGKDCLTVIDSRPPGPAEAGGTVDAAAGGTTNAVGTAGVAEGTHPSNMTASETVPLDSQQANQPRDRGPCASVGGCGRPEEEAGHIGLENGDADGRNDITRPVPDRRSREVSR